MDRYAPRVKKSQQQDLHVVEKKTGLSLQPPGPLPKDARCLGPLPNNTQVITDSFYSSSLDLWLSLPVVFSRISSNWIGHSSPWSLTNAPLFTNKVNEPPISHLYLLPTPSQRTPLYSTDFSQLHPYLIFFSPMLFLFLHRLPLSTHWYLSIHLNFQNTLTCKKWISEFHFFN